MIPPKPGRRPLSRSSSDETNPSTMTSTTPSMTTRLKAPSPPPRPGGGKTVSRPVPPPRPASFRKAKENDRPSTQVGLPPRPKQETPVEVPVKPNALPPPLPPSTTCSSNSKPHPSIPGAGTPKHSSKRLSSRRVPPPLPVWGQQTSAASQSATSTPAIATISTTSKEESASQNPTPNSNAGEESQGNNSEAHSEAQIHIPAERQSENHSHVSDSTTSGKPTGKVSIPPPLCTKPAESNKSSRSSIIPPPISAQTSSLHQATRKATTPSSLTSESIQTSQQHQQEDLASTSSGSFSSGNSYQGSPVTRVRRTGSTASCARKDSQQELIPGAPRAPKTLAKARISYDGSGKGHLTFCEGQIIEIIDQEHEEQKEDMATDENGLVLWKGRAIRDGKEVIGYFPSMHVALIKPSRRASSNSFGPLRSADSFNSVSSGHRNGNRLNAECISPEMVKKEKHCNALFHALMEVVDTEMRHVHDLQTVLRVFMLPFQKAYGQVLTRQVFSDWVPLLRVHEQVLLKLAEGLPSVEALVNTFSVIKGDPRVQRAIRSQQAESTGFAHEAVLKQSFSTSCNMASNEEATPAFGQDLVSQEYAENLRHLIKMLEHIHKEHLSEFVFLDNSQIDAWQAALEDTTVKICKAMVEMSDWLKLCIPCVVNQPVACKALQKGKYGHSVSPKQFIQQKEYEERSRLHNLDLSSFLIKPMQRITKYPLLMREIVKNNDGSEKSQTIAREAFEKVSKIANDVNEIMKQHQDFDSKKALELLHQLRPKETVERVGLGDQSRTQRLYRFGKVSFQTLTTGLGNNGNHTTQLQPSESDSGGPSMQIAKIQGVNTGSCYAMLFTNVLFLTLRATNKWKTKTKYHIIKVVEVKNITAVDALDGCLAIRTACSVILLTALQDDVLRWQVDLQDCMRIVAADRERQDAAEAQKQQKRNLNKPAQRRSKSVDLSKPRPNSAELFNSFMQELQNHSRFAAAS